MSNERNAGRHKGLKFRVISANLTPNQIAFLTKQGGNKYLRALIEREMTEHKSIKVCSKCGQVHKNCVDGFGMGEK